MTKREAKRDLEFLQEIKRRLDNRNDETQREYAMKMICDWIEELRQRMEP